MAFTPGQKIGPYEIVRRVGEGGLGEVYEARDSRLLRSVAIKVLKSPDPVRFEREARALATLSSPHICQIFDIGPDYLVLEFVNGNAAAGPLPAEQVLPLALQIVSALEVAHGQGILHRDLKPANIIISDTGAKLLDFGLAKLRAGTDADLTQSLPGAISGTAAFMSPEQARGEAVDDRSDLFSFGATLYYLLSGRNPFNGASLFATLHAVIHDDPVPLNSRLAPLVMRCLAKDPAQRFQSASQLKAALLEVDLHSRSSAQIAPSVAVLPFANLSSDKEQEFFSDGLAEEIIGALVKVPGLKVIARTSAFAFKGLNVDVREIAGKLGVSHVLEGSVRKSGNRIRVNAQLITARDGAHVWSERFDRQLADVFEVQDEIAAAIAGTLVSKFASAPQARRHIPKPAAHDAYLKALFLAWKLTSASSDQASRLFEKAIAIDPEYAAPYAAYADHLTGRAAYGFQPLIEVRALIRRMAEKALELDPGLPHAHCIFLGWAIYDTFDPHEAERRLTLIEASQGASAWVQTIVAASLFVLGRTEEALQKFDRALDADPLNPMTRAFTAMALGGLGKHVEAEKNLLFALELDPEFQIGNNLLASLYASQGKFEAALPFAQRAHAVNPSNATEIGQYAALLSLTGQEERGAEVLKLMPSPESYGTAIGWGMYHLLKNELAEAAMWFERAFDERMPQLKLRMLSAVTRPLRASPYWPRLASIMNLPPAFDASSASAATAVLS